MDISAVDMEIARRTLRVEGAAIASLVDQIGDDFARAAAAVFHCRGKVVLTGIGKAGIIAQKISATMASTGTPSIFLHPVEALHGDLGRVDRIDVVVALSHSGATQEIIRLVDHIKGRGATLIAVSGPDGSPLVRHADIAVRYGDVQEACPHGLAPTVSTTCMLALGDALALTVMQMRRFKAEDFAVFHPGGSLGRKLLKVEEAMSFKDDDHLHVVSDALTLEQALVEAERVKRRTGAMLLIDAAGRLSGILTDADLRRVLATRGRQNILDEPVAAFMTRNPKNIAIGSLASEALAILNKYRIDELPVVDAAGKPVGVIDVQDLLGIKTVADEESA
ncbi:MAG: KpsF/GutQ family sugar-phosphate isomerase [Planctomycetaceae bacterium]|nr:KpsF/GutQ family sugar-phosphate isomerase [Planctomycetaceae bacterium]